MDSTVLAQRLALSRERFVRFAERRLGARPDAEDVVQRAWTRAVAQAESVRDEARAEAWFYRILRRMIIDHQRATRSREVATDEEVVSPVPQESTECHCVGELLGELPPAYATVLQEVVVNGETPDEMGEKLEIASGNVHVRVHRAKSALRARLAARCGVDSLRACLACTCDTDTRCCDALGHAK